MRKKLGSLLRNGYTSFEKWREYSNLRKQADSLRNVVVRKKGKSFIDGKLLQTIYEYAKSNFGSKDFAAWLLLYTEIREKFIEGWIPNDFYTNNLIPDWNPREIAKISNIKTFDHRLFHGFSLDPIAIRVSGQYYEKNQNPLNKQDIKEILNNYNGEVVIKKDSGPSGKGIVFIQSGDAAPWEIPLEYDIVIQPSVRQHEIMNKLYPQSVNTFRVFTFLEPDGKVDIKAVLLRFGTGGTRIDNVMSGGCYLPVAGFSTGDVSFDGLGFARGNRHPDTGFEFKSMFLPFVEKVQTACIKSHLAFPYVRFIGWDVCIDEEGTPKLIEWNAWNPTFWRYEARVGPFWKSKPV